METDTAFMVNTGIAFCFALLACVSIGFAVAQQRVDAATFARTAAATDAFEIQSSRLALERSSNPRVRAFAQHMIDDHAMTTTALSRSTPAMAMFLEPRILDERHATMLSQLEAESGPAFDRLYDGMQLAAHREAIALYSAYASEGDDPQLVSFARATLPALRQHLAMARRL
jgi:putative membrane protein